MGIPNNIKKQSLVASKETTGGQMTFFGLGSRQFLIKLRVSGPNQILTLTEAEVRMPYLGKIGGSDWSKRYSIAQSPGK